MNEAGIIGRIRKYLRTVDGLFFWKEHGGQYGTGGIPDIIVCYQGRFIAFECKTDKGKVTTLQEATIKQIRAAGGIAEVVRSAEEVKAILEKYKR